MGFLGFLIEFRHISMDILVYNFLKGEYKYEDRE